VSAGAGRFEDAAGFAASPAVRLPRRAGANARGAFLVTPEGFALAAQSAGDNRYMDLAVATSSERALAQHRALQRALAEVVPTIAFAGDAATPDAVFPNNVFATAPGRLILGHMRHPVRQREAERADIRAFFTGVLGYAEHDLRRQPGICELTGSMVIDRGRGLGFVAYTERCDRAGADAMHEAFGLQASFRFALKAEEYHANVVMSVLAGRALVICPDAFADAAAPAAIAACYAPALVELSAAEKNAFAGNCIALADDVVHLSEAAADALAPHNRAALERLGFRLVAVPLDEIEKAGGSLRCCVGEIF
jgi:hypothetical protein